LVIYAFKVADFPKRNIVQTVIVLTAALVSLSMLLIITFSSFLLDRLLNLNKTKEKAGILHNKYFRLIIEMIKLYLD